MLFWALQVENADSADNGPGALLQPKVLYSWIPTWPCYVGLSVCPWFHIIRLQCDAIPSLIPDHQCRLLNHLGLYLFKDLIRPFRFLSFEVKEGLTDSNYTPREIYVHKLTFKLACGLREMWRLCQTASQFVVFWQICQSQVSGSIHTGISLVTATIVNIAFEFACDLMEMWRFCLTSSQFVIFWRICRSQISASILLVTLTFCVSINLHFWI